MTITLRSIPPELARVLREKADAQKKSLSKVAMELLTESAGIRAPKKAKVAHRDLDGLAGVWSKAEAAAFDRALKSQRKIDPEKWQ